MRQEQKFFMVIYAGLLCALVPWFMIQYHQSINPDLVYLTQSAIYFLSGERLYDAYYDNNPPLCILVYVIPAAIIKYLELPFYLVLLGYNIALVLLSSMLVYCLLRPFEMLQSTEKHLITIAYILTNTLAANLYLGEKDHYIILGLFPFALLQLCMIYQYKIASKIAFPVLFLGAVFLMIKPHYYLIPAALILARMTKRRSLRCAFAMDSYAILIAAMMYALALVTYFYDYTALVLPDALAFYVTEHKPWVVQLSAIGMILCFVCTLCAYYMPKTPDTITAILMALAFLCLIPFGLQGKGFFYHIQPALAFFACGLAMMLFRVAQSIKINNWVCLTAISVAIGGGYYGLFYGQRAVLTHDEYRATSLARIINDCDTGECGYLMFNDSIEMAQQLSIYTEKPHASRFAAFWWLPSILKMDEADPMRATLAQKYGDMVAQDLERIPAHTLILGHFHIQPDQEEPFNIITFFSAHSPKFAKIIQNYDLHETIAINPKEYFPNTLVGNAPVTFDIHKKNAGKKFGHTQD